MRQIGTLPTEKQAQRFAAYLITQGITSHSEPDGDGFVIWVRDENHLGQAHDAIDQFRLDPEDRRYQSVEQQAGAMLQEEEQRRQQAQKNIVQMRSNWRQRTGKKAPLIFVLIGMSVLVGLMTNFGGDRKASAMRLLMFRDPIHFQNPETQSDILVDIKRGQVWRLITPIFLHANMMHLVFNMYMLYVFGSQIEDRRGTLRLVLLVLFIGLSSDLAQAWISGPNFLGMSGIVYGLFGYAWMKSRFDLSAGIQVSPITVVIMIAWFFACLAGVFENIANTAHGVGLATGLVIGYAPLLWRQFSGR